MKVSSQLLQVCVAATGVFVASSAFAGNNDDKFICGGVIQDDEWKFMLASPGWMAGLEGDVGINGVISHINVDPGDIIRHYDMVASLRGEASKGRFGITGDFLYLSLSDGVGTPGVVKKLDLQLDQIIADLGVRWRLIDSPRGSLDVIAGARYTNIYQKLVLQPNDPVISETSRGFVDTVASRTADRLLGALSESGFRDKVGDAVQDKIESVLGALENRDPVLPEGPLGDRLRGRITEAVQRLVEANKDEVAAAIKRKGLTAAAAIRAEVDAGKARLSKRIARVLHDSLDTRVARTDDWFDPYIGLRGRLNLNSAWYLTVKGDVGGFGVGADLSWQVEGAIGCQLTRHIFAEAGYRALGVDYEQDGLIYNTITHGAQVTMGISF